MKRYRRHKATNENSEITPAASIQRKLTVGATNDPMEHEADNMAGKVMSMPDSSFVQRKPSSSCCDYDDEHVHLKPSSGQVSPFIQAKGGDGGAATKNVSTGIKATRGKGSEMSGPTKSFMESRFGSDFSDVKIHTGDYAAQLSNDLSAQAFTVGSDIYFNSGKYAPGDAEGKRLLAHELTHVVQQSKSNKAPNVQRDPITGTQSSTASYDLDGQTGRQAKTGSKTSGFAEAKVSYDEASSTFTVTFSLAWIFPHGWDDTKRDAFVADFEKAIQDIWQDRFVLNETGGKHRSAHVKIAMDENVVHQMKDSFEEAMALDKILKSKSAWLMDTRDVFVRDNVSGTRVQLDQDANKNQSRKGSSIRAGTGFSVNDGNDNTTFTQNTSAHEFGHMIGLGDEYLNDSGTSASQIDPARAYINNRIMNVGNAVTPDVYAPFADWLSNLTNTAWTVGRKVR